MLRITSVDSTSTDLIVVGKDSTVDKVAYSGVDGARVGIITVKSKRENKNKSKNLIKVLTKNSGSNFLTPRAWRIFIELRQSLSSHQSLIILI